MQAVRKSQFLSSRQEGCRYFYVLRTAAIFFLISLAQNSANAFSCDCLTAEETKAFELASITCKTEMQNLQCSKLTDVDPSLQEDLQKCDVKSVCEALTQERMNATGQVSPTTVKACFWASAELVKEVWGLATSVPPEIQPYLSNPFGLSFLIGKKLGENLAQTTKEDWANLPQKISDATSDENIIKQSKKIWSSGVDWAKDKKLKLQCFNVQAQQEMVCYGILSVWPLTEEQRAAKIAELDRQISEARRNITIKSGTINGLKQADAKFLELTTARSAILRGETTFYNIQVVDVSKTDNAVERLVKGIRMQSGGLETPIHVSKLGTTAEKTTSKIKLVRYGGLALLGISVIDALSINTDPIESSTQVTGTR